eukprot:scaffold1930_cov181-Pinguiococcus_pyrenoidosus.AAC.1
MHRFLFLSVREPLRRLQRPPQLAAGVHALHQLVAGLLVEQPVHVPISGEVPHLLGVRLQRVRVQRLQEVRPRVLVAVSPAARMATDEAHPDVVDDVALLARAHGGVAGIVSTNRARAAAATQVAVGVEHVITQRRQDAHFAGEIDRLETDGAARWILVGKQVGVGKAACGRFRRLTARLGSPKLLHDAYGASVASKAIERPAVVALEHRYKKTGAVIPRLRASSVPLTVTPHLPQLPDCEAAAALRIWSATPRAGKPE